MKINSISNNCHFGSFKLENFGAYTLAEYFAEHPEKEADFMVNVIEPLEKSDSEVIYNGYTVAYKHAKEKEGHGIVNGYGSDPNVLAIISHDYRRQACYRLSDIEPTENFRVYPLGDIETAKNIIMDRDCYYNKIAAKAYAEAHKNETFEDKVKRLEKRFGVDA